MPYFETKLHEDIGSRSTSRSDSINDLVKFGKMVALVSFSPFKTAARLWKMQMISRKVKVYSGARFFSLEISDQLICRYRSTTT